MGEASFGRVGGEELLEVCCIWSEVEFIVYIMMVGSLVIVRILVVIVGIGIIQRLKLHSLVVALGSLEDVHLLVPVGIIAHFVIKVLNERSEEIGEYAFLSEVPGC
ncbi:MAG: hypothetical protein ACMG6E_08820 [Candidatus Roizmanbacteria bacterium]